MPYGDKSMYSAYRAFTVKIRQLCDENLAFKSHYFEYVKQKAHKVRKKPSAVNSLLTLSEKSYKSIRQT